MRVCTARSSSKRTALCGACGGCSLALAPTELGSVESLPLVPMSWGGWKSWQAKFLSPGHARGYKINRAQSFDRIAGGMRAAVSGVAACARERALAARKG